MDKPHWLALGGQLANTMRLLSGAHAGLKPGATSVTPVPSAFIIIILVSPAFSLPCTYIKRLLSGDHCTQHTSPPTSLRGLPPSTLAT